ncbi:MAG: ammonia-dependent NAD(+) synthetase, partial [Marmoricola sp.]
IASALGVSPSFDPEWEVGRRITFLSEYLEGSGAAGYVLGISGGVDSTVAGRLAQLSCDRTGTALTALRLPYGQQADEHDARAALAFIKPATIATVNIKLAVDALHEATAPAEGFNDPAQGDFIKGNIKARQRMIAQYAVAGRLGALVVGTGHAAEAVMGFFTKHGDGACDVAPLSGLTKSRVLAIGKYLGAPEPLLAKVPTADLEDDRPGLPDEEAYGVSYADIDAYLTGQEISESAREIIETTFRATAHKRTLPPWP